MHGHLLRMVHVTCTVVVGGNLSTAYPCILVLTAAVGRVDCCKYLYLGYLRMFYE